MGEPKNSKMLPFLPRTLPRFELIVLKHSLPSPLEIHGLSSNKNSDPQGQVQQGARVEISASAVDLLTTALRNNSQDQRFFDITGLI